MYKYCYNYIFIVQSSCDKLSDKLFESHRSSLDKLFDAYISSLDRQLSDKLSELYKSLSITSIAQDRGNHPFTRFPASPPFCSFSPNSQYLQKNTNFSRQTVNYLEEGNIKNFTQNQHNIINHTFSNV